MDPSSLLFGLLFPSCLLPELVEVAKALVIEKEEGKVEDVGADTDHTEVMEHREEDVGQVK